jgi:hypothetical protein
MIIRRWLLQTSAYEAPASEERVSITPDDTIFFMRENRQEAERCPSSRFNRFAGLAGLPAANQSPTVTIYPMA